MHPQRAALGAGAQALGLALDERQIERLLAYLDLLLKWNRVYNLTAVRDPAEMLTHHDEAWLVPAGDQHKLAAALKQALTDHFAGNPKMLSMARARAARHYHHLRALPRHLQLIREAWLG